MARYLSFSDAVLCWCGTNDSPVSVTSQCSIERLYMIHCSEQASWWWPAKTAVCSNELAGRNPQQCTHSQDRYIADSVTRPATKRFHASDWSSVEACCRPWTWWCNDATALATMMMMMMNQCTWLNHDTVNESCVCVCVYVYVECRVGWFGASCQHECHCIRDRQKFGFGYGVSAETTQKYGFGLVSVTAKRNGRITVSVETWPRRDRNRSSFDRNQP